MHARTNEQRVLNDCKLNLSCVKQQQSDPLPAKFGVRQELLLLRDLALLLIF